MGFLIVLTTSLLAAMLGTQWIIFLISFFDKSLYMLKIKTRRDAILWLIPYRPMVLWAVKWFKEKDFKTWASELMGQFDTEEK